MYIVEQEVSAKSLTLVAPVQMSLTKSVLVCAPMQKTVTLVDDIINGILKQNGHDNFLMQLMNTDNVIRHDVGVEVESSSCSFASRILVHSCDIHTPPRGLSSDVINIF